MLTIKFKGEEYELSTKLRAAFEMQSKFGHKPYMEIFQDVQTMKLEEQIKMIYVSFNLMNPNICSETDFRNELLDNWNLTDVTSTIAKLIEAITFNGMSPEEVAQRKKEIQMQMKKLR